MRNNNLGMFQGLIGGPQQGFSVQPPQYQGYADDSGMAGQGQQAQPPGMYGTGYGPGLAPWWTGHTDQFMGGMGPLGPEMTEMDARQVLHAIGQSYQQGRNPSPPVPWDGGYGGGSSPNVPPQDNSNTPVQQPAQSSTPFMDAYLRAKQRQEEPNI